MKNFKSLLAASALSTVACTANAMVWDVTMTTNTYFSGLMGPLIMNLSGTYDDAASWVDSDGIARQGVADVAGQIQAPGFSLTADMSSILFSMDFTTGVGYANPPAASDCASNSVSACLAIPQVLNAPLYNNIDFNGANSTGAPFASVPGIYTWTMVTSRVVDGDVQYLQLPFTVTLGGYEAPPPGPEDVPDESDDTPPVGQVDTPPEPDYTPIPPSTIPPTASVPEPNSIALILAGLAGILITRRGKLYS